MNFYVRVVSFPSLSSPCKKWHYRNIFLDKNIRYPTDYSQQTIYTSCLHVQDKCFINIFKTFCQKQHLTYLIRIQLLFLFNFEVAKIIYIYIYLYLSVHVLPNICLGHFCGEKNLSVRRQRVAVALPNNTHMTV